MLLFMLRESVLPNKKIKLNAGLKIIIREITRVIQYQYFIVFFHTEENKLTGKIIYISV